jgi:hypothetical protein
MRKKALVLVFVRLIHSCDFVDQVGFLFDAAAQRQQRLPTRLRRLRLGV